jgi:type II secretory pathway pseudopilin PulG
MNRLNLKSNNIGATLVEVLVAIALLGIMTPALTTAFVTSYNSRPSSDQKLIATNILKKLSTVVRNVRENSWSNISVNGTYHPSASGNSWALVTNAETVNGFTDQIVISDIQRDSGGNIVSTGGTVDPSTKLFTNSVSWTRPNSSSVSNTIYLTRWQNASSWTQTTNSDFSSDNLVNVTVTNFFGGEAQLSNGQTSGTLTSSTFDAGSNVGFSSLLFNSSNPTGSDLKIQIATNNDNSTWNYVGPDGTNSSFYSSSGVIPLNQVSGRYFRYIATLTTTNSTYPSLNDITLTYSH